MRITPEQPPFNAVGDGNVDDTEALQACIDAALDRGNCIVELMPQEQYNISEPLVVRGQVLIQGAQPFITEIHRPTIQTIGNHPAFIYDCFDGGCIRDVSIRGQGSHNPLDTEPEDESTPAIISFARLNIENVSVTRKGGLAPPGLITNSEKQTGGYVVGFLCRDNDNLNNSRVINLRVGSCTGDGVFIDVLSGRANTNAMYVNVERYFQSQGYAVNAPSGFRNEYRIGHVESAPNICQGAVRLGYAGNHAYVRYVEGTVPVIADFPDGNSNRNRVDVIEIPRSTLPANNLRRNTVHELHTDILHYGPWMKPQRNGAPVSFDKPVKAPNISTDQQDAE